MGKISDKESLKVDAFNEFKRDKINVA